MTVYKVNNTSQLASAMKNARSGDTIAMEGGNYGTLRIDDRTAKDGLSFVSVNANKPAVFSEVIVRGMSEISFEGITFKGTLKDGYGFGTGLEVTDRSSGISVKECVFEDYFTAALFRGHSKNVSIVDSDLRDIAGDAIRFSTVNGGLAEHNTVSMRALPLVDHKDMIQIANGGSNITLRENVMQASDGMTHGIYMGNVKAKVSLDLADFYKNIVVENNIILGGQMHGISAGEVDGLVIRGNVVLQHPDVSSQKTVYTPSIHVAKDSVNVKIEDNVTHKTPGAADINWFKVPTPAKWQISDNTIVPTKTTVEKVLGYDPFKEGVKPGTPTPEKPVAPSEPDVSPEAPQPVANLVFDAREDQANVRKPIDVDFAAGDTFEFRGFAAGTFKGVSGGNALELTRKGDAVRFDSVEDIRELDQASKAVSIHTAGEDLIVKVASKAGVMEFRFEDMADDYLDLPPIRKTTVFVEGSTKAAAKTISEDIDFGHGDTIILRNFAAKTFQDVGGGNDLEIWRKGGSAVINSVEDLRELVSASPAVSARVAQDDLVLKIAQSGSAQTIVLDGMADAYLDTGHWLV